MTAQELERLLDSLDSELAGQYLQFRNTLQTAVQLTQRLQEAAQRIQNADDVLVEVQTGGAAADDLKSLFDLLDRIEESPAPFRNSVALPAQVAARVQSARQTFRTLSNVQVADIQALQPVVELYRYIQDAGRTSAHLQNFVALTFQEWLGEQGVLIDIPGVGNLTLRFRGDDRGPLFGRNAGLSVEVIYEGGYRVNYNGVRLEYSLDEQGDFTVVPRIDFSQSPQLNVSQVAASLLQEALARVSLPGLSILSFEPPQVRSDITPPELLIKASFNGVASFNGLQFTAILRINAKTGVQVEGEARLPFPTLIVPIPGTPLAFHGLTIEFKTIGQLLSFETKVALLATPPDQSAHFRVEVGMQIGNLANGISFEGDFNIIGLAGPTRVGGIKDGKIRGDLVQAQLLMPDPVTSVFPVPRSVFFVDAKARLDEEGLRCDGRVEFLTHAKGGMNLFVASDGSGFATSKVEIAILGVQAAVSAIFERQFQNPIVTATGSLKVRVPHFDDITASIEAVARQGGAVNIQAMALGDSFSLSLPGLDSNVLEALRDKLVEEGAEIADRIWQKAQDILAEADVFNRKSAIRLAIASLGVFVENNIQEAIGIRDDIRTQFGDAFDWFKVDLKNPFSIGEWRNPFAPSRAERTGGSGAAITPALLDAFKLKVLRLAEDLNGLEISEIWSSGAEAPIETDLRITSEIELKFDQVVAALVNLVDGAFTFLVTFTIVGATRSVRLSRSQSSAHAEWAKIELSYGDGSGEDAVINLPDLADASVLHAKNYLYQAIRQRIEQRFGNIGSGGDLGEPDPNDPGPPPPPDPSLFPPRPQLSVNEDNDVPAFTLTLLKTSQWRARYTRNLTGEVRRTNIHFHDSKSTYQVFNSANQYLTEGWMTGVTYAQSGTLYTIRGIWHELGESGPFNFIVNPTTGKFDGNWSVSSPGGEDGTWQGEAAPVPFV